MEQYQVKIEEVLTQALTEKTFSLEIIEKIKSLKDGFTSNAKLVDELQNRLEFITKENTELKSKLQDTTLKLDSYVAREKSIADKEKALEKTNYELEFQKIRANEIKELMMIVFKNPVVRKSTFTTDYNTNKNESSNLTEEVD